jgi:DNA-binding Lrp family transcriptional regulator
MIRFMVFLRIKTERFSSFLAYCHEDNRIKQNYKLTGEYDVLLEVEVESMEEYYNFYRKVTEFKGIQAMNSHIVMREWKT